MLRFIAKRVLGLIVILFCVITITFFLIRLMPGGPFDRERKLPEHIEKQLLAKYKLDGPLPEQYLNYLGDLLHGDLRLSTKYRSRSVNEILADSLPVSGLLGGIAFCAATIGGVFLGSLAASKQHTWIDRNSMLAALLAISLPPFVIGPLLVLVFAIYIPVFPVGGWGTLQSLILPSITLAAPYTAYIARLTRASMLEVLTQDYIRTARAKGLSENAVIYKHALRVAILPVVSFLGPLGGQLVNRLNRRGKHLQYPRSWRFFRQFSAQSRRISARRRRDRLLHASGIIQFGGRCPLWLPGSPHHVV